jgi:hypothetical protein
VDVRAGRVEDDHDAHDMTIAFDYQVNMMTGLGLDKVAAIADLEFEKSSGDIVKLEPWRVRILVCRLEVSRFLYTARIIVSP